MQNLLAQTMCWFCELVLSEAVGGTQAGRDADAEAAAEESEQHSSESDLTPSGRFQQQQVAFFYTALRMGYLRFSAHFILLRTHRRGAEAKLLCVGFCQTWAILLVTDRTALRVQGGRRSDDEDMDLEQIDIRALERVSPRTSLMAPEQVLHIYRACLLFPY